jgi:hypothetical protein
VQLAQVFLEQELRERKEGKGTYLDEVEMESKKGVPAAESNVGVLPLLDILVKRASDKVATVRAKALQDLGTVLQMVDANPTLRTDIERLLQLRPGAATAAEADKTNLLSMLQRRIVDEKATVRKAAIQVLMLLRAHTFLNLVLKAFPLFLSFFAFKTFEALGGYYDELVLGAAELRLLADRCSDPAVSIRKQVSGAIAVPLARVVMGREDLPRCCCVCLSRAGHDRSGESDETPPVAPHALQGLALCRAAAGGRPRGHHHREVPRRGGGARV